MLSVLPVPRNVTRRWLLWVWVFASGMVFAAGCRGGCSGEDIIAELTAKKGAGIVDRDTAENVRQWAPADDGAQFRLGDGLRTGKDSSAHLELSGGGEVQVESDTIIRFSNGVAGTAAAGVSVELGSAQVSAGAEPITVVTGVGTAVVESQAALSIASSGEGFRFEVTVGKVRLEHDGKQEVLEKGAAIDVGIGEAVIDEAAEQRPDAGPTDAGPPQPTGPIVAEVSGRSAMKKAPGDKRFVALAPGSTTLEGATVVRLGKGSTMSVSRGSEQASLVGSGEFVVGREDGTLVEVRAGKVAVADSKGSVRIAAPGGSIVTAGGAVGDVSVGKSSTRVSVQAQRATVRGADGKAEVVEAGQEATLDHEGAVEVEGRALDHADMRLGAGSSVIVHDPAPPTAVGLLTNKACPGGAVVELASPGRKTQIRGSGQVNVPFPPGRHRYGVRCVEAGTPADETVAEGHVTVVRDAGTAPLPRTAPATRVDADGRNYTVLYQNRLPRITIAWPRAPGGGGYSLHVTSGGRSRTVSTANATHTFASGQLGEGTHRMQFSAASGAKSKTTTVRVQFDNAAPKASLRTPASRSFPPGSTVTVSGVALPGWSVSVGRKKLPVDGQYRFSGKATAPSDQRALEVVFEHQSRGAHHYIRRSSAAD